jgi:hypothetical protein
MRTATFVVVLVIHGLLFFLFAKLRSPSRPVREAEVPTTVIFLPESEPESTPAPQPERQPKPPVSVRAARPAAPRTPTRANPPPEPESSSITPTPSPDWRAQAQIAANDELEAEARKRQQPSRLAPHDFSGVRPGSTDDSKPKFGWNHARTHRVEELSGGGLLVNINDRCAVVVIYFFALPACKIGKMPARGDLFEHMQEAPAVTDSKVP